MRIAKSMKWANNLLLADMGFRPCKAYPDLWMRRKANYYEYVAVMVDDLLVFSREPELIIEPIIDHAASYLFKKKKLYIYFNANANVSILPKEFKAPDPV